MSWHSTAILPGGIHRFWVQDKRLNTQALSGKMASAEGRESSKPFATCGDKVTGAKTPVEE